MTALLTFPFDYVAQCFVSVCLAVLFVQSGVDKVVDRSGNLDFHREHFAKSPLAGLVPLLLTTLTALELLSGALCSVGFVVVASGGSTLVAGACQHVGGPRETGGGAGCDGSPCQQRTARRCARPRS